MRCMVKVTIPAQGGNEAIKSGKIGAVLEGFMSETKPEAAYFMEQCGQRTAYFFVNINDSSQIPAFAEPWWLAVGASVEVHPAMTFPELQKGLSNIGDIVKKYG